MSISDFAAACPLVLCAPPPPSQPAPVMLPQAHLVLASAPPAAFPRFGPRSQLPTKAAASTQTKQLRYCRSSSFASTTATPLSSEESASDSASEEDVSGGAFVGARAALPQVHSVLMKDLRVRKTFFELPIEPEDGHELRRRSRSAPPLGRLGASVLSCSGVPEASGVAALDAGVPSVGSRLHAARECKPCAFVHTVQGCKGGMLCQFCHLCDSDEKKRRQKTRWEEKRTTWRLWRKQERRREASQRQAMAGRQQ